LSLPSAALISVGDESRPADAPGAQFRFLV
jgi:hypothetical protein